MKKDQLKKLKSIYDCVYDNFYEEIIQDTAEDLLFDGNYEADVKDYLEDISIKLFNQLDLKKVREFIKYDLVEEDILNKDRLNLIQLLLSTDVEIKSKGKLNKEVLRCDDIDELFEKICHAHCVEICELLREYEELL